MTAEWLWLSASLFAALLWLAILPGFVWMRFRLPRLDREPPDAPESGWPRLSVIVPARDEQAEIEAATRSVLGGDYPELELIAVDDRSADRTGEILDRLALEDPRLRVVHVRELPAGWLGKNHACHAGAERARGAWLLFADGDVHLGASALRRAVAFAERHRLGHVVAFPRLVTSGFLERAFVSAFTLLLTLKFRPWELGRPGTAAYVGAGAFNLVRADAYRRVGGHRTLALEVVDDVKLGLILRRSGVPQSAVDSNGLVSVRWQRGLAASLRGLVKNAFAGVEWRWRMTLVGAFVIALLSCVPLLALIAAPGRVPRALGLLSLAISLPLHGLIARHSAGGSGLEGLAFPPAGLALLAVCVWSALAATWGGAVEWRGTRYPTAVLKAGCVRDRDWPRARAVGWRRTG